MAMRRNQKGKGSFNKEKAIDPGDHAQNPPQIILFFYTVFVIMTASVIVEAKDLQRRRRGKQLDIYSTKFIHDSQLKRTVHCPIPGV